MNAQTRRPHAHGTTARVLTRTEATRARVRPVGFWAKITSAV